MHMPMHIPMHLLMMFVPLLAIGFGVAVWRLDARRGQGAIADRVERTADNEYRSDFGRADDNREADLRRLEPAIFRAAARCGGVLTVSDVVLETDLPVDTCRTLLERMTDGEHVRMEVTNSGRVEYHFPEIRTRKE